MALDLSTSKLLEIKKAEISAVSNTDLNPRKEIFLVSNKERERVLSVNNQSKKLQDVVISDVDRSVIEAINLSEKRINKNIEKVSTQQKLSASETMALLFEVDNIVKNVQLLLKIASANRKLREHVLNSFIIS